VVEEVASHEIRDAVAVEVPRGQHLGEGAIGQDGADPEGAVAVAGDQAHTVAARDRDPGQAVAAEVPDQDPARLKISEAESQSRQELERPVAVTVQHSHLRSQPCHPKLKV